MDHKRFLRKLLKNVRIGTILSLAFFVGFVLVSTVFADDALPVVDKGLGLPFTEQSGNAAPAPISALIKQVILYTGILAVISLTWGGFLFMTAFGEDEKVKKGKTVVKFSIIGVLLSISAYAIVDMVNRLTV